MVIGWSCLEDEEEDDEEDDMEARLWCEELEESN